MNLVSSRKALSVVLFLAAVWTVEIDLLNLRSHWVGKGVSLLYPKQMKLLSNKLTSQVGMMTTFTQLPVGTNWELRGELKLKCQSSKLLTKEENDFGIALWLTKNNQRSGFADYNFNDYFGNFGMTANMEGLSMIFYKNNLYTGLFKSDKLSRDDLMNRSKVCKAYLEKEEEIKFAIKYRSNILGVYFIEQRDRIENLCFQFTDVKDFDQFYTSIGAGDKQSNCSADLSELTVKTDYVDYQFVTNDQKRPEDSTLSYFPADMTTDNKKNFDHFHKVYDFYRENAKIFAKQLLMFADKNEKELVADIRKEITAADGAIDKAVKVIEDQAKQIEFLNQALTVERKTTGESIDSVLDQILQWMGQMDDAFDRVDVETQNIYAALTKTNYDKQLDELITKASVLSKKLYKVMQQTKSITANKDLQGLDEGRISEWHFDVFNFFSDAKASTAKKTTERTSRLRSIGLIVLGAIAFSIIIAFCVMYFKIKKAMRYKRVL